MQSQDSFLDNKIVKSFTSQGKMYTLEKRADNLFVVRDGYKTLKISTTLEPAEQLFEEYKVTMKGGENMGEGYKKAKEASEKLKVEKTEIEETAVAEKEEVKTQLATIQANSELAQMYQDSAKLGAENLAGELPLLKVHVANKSMNNALSDGTEPNDGWFFYKSTQEQFPTIDCHILTISKGFKAEGLEQKDGGKKTVFNQIVGGVILPDYKPFIMYFTGLKLPNLWEFGKEASRYTRAKPVAIPMFALTIRMKTQPKTHSMGKSPVVTFEIVKSMDGVPQLVLDPGEFTFLKDTVATTEEMIQSLIEAKAESESATAVPVTAVDAVEEDYTV